MQCISQLVKAARHVGDSWVALLVLCLREFCLRAGKLANP